MKVTNRLALGNHLAYLKTINDDRGWVEQQDMQSRRRNMGRSSRAERARLGWRFWRSGRRPGSQALILIALTEPGRRPGYRRMVKPPSYRPTGGQSVCYPPFRGSQQQSGVCSAGDPHLREKNDKNIRSAAFLFEAPKCWCWCWRRLFGDGRKRIAASEPDRP